jgi:hypothetical protein
MNDISLLAIKGRLKLFVGDCVIFYRSKSVIKAVQKMNEGLDLLADYYYLNKITPNASKIPKTKFIVLSAVNKVIQSHLKFKIAG